MHDPMNLAAEFDLREERFEHADFMADILLPASSDAMIDEREFDADERLPYWAELWPAAKALARYLVELGELPSRALELGCGVGLPALVLHHRGVDVLATDYYADALRFAEANAERNGAGALATLLLDWRFPPPGLQAYPLVLAADVLYEERNLSALEILLPRVVAAGGHALIADPGRLQLPVFRERLAIAGWGVRDLGTRGEPAFPDRPLEVRVQLLRLDPPVSP